MSDELGVRWIHGPAGCATNADPAFQVFALDASTDVLRQNECHNFEAPFLYLLTDQFGDDPARTVRDDFILEPLGS